MADQIRDALERVAAARPVQNTAPAVSPATQPAESATLPNASTASAAPTQDTRQAPSPKTEIRTLIVDPLHQGDHPTITAAIAAARPGDRITVRPGLYREGLIIEKPLEIIGDGPTADVVLEATGQDVILFKASMGRVANLTLRQMGGGEWCGVEIAQGRLDLEDCDISSESLVCVAIHGGADPRIRRCRIHDGKEGGVFVYKQGRGSLEDNEIFGNSIAGVAIKSGGDPTLRRNTIRDGKAAGVFVQAQGRGTLEDNEIVGNAHAGVAIATGGNPTLRRNRIKMNGYEAVWVTQGGGGTFEDNDLRDNTRGAWDISEDSAKSVKRARNQE